MTTDRQSKPLKQGTAIVVDREKAVVNCRFIESGNKVLLRRENVQIEAEVQYVDRPRDLCQLHVPNLAAPSIALAPPDSLRVGARAYVIGNAEGLENTMSDGIVSGVRRTEGRLAAVQTTASSAPGGGGLFDVQGRLIGVMAASAKDAQNLSLAMPAGWIAELPARHLTASTPGPVSVAPVAAVSVPQQAQATVAELRPGDTLEYRLTEQLTDTSQTVIFRLDSLQGGRLIFNEGRRIESGNGGLLSKNEPQGGELDLLTTEQGWDRSTYQAGAVWHERYVNERGGTKAAYRLKVRHLGNSRIRVAAGEFDAVAYALEGYLTRDEFASGRYQAKLWYSTALRRPVLFEVSTRSTGNRGASTFNIRERFELMRVTNGGR
nr:serine protease [Caldimonas mangrovi]